MNNKVVQVARYSTISCLFKALQSPAFIFGRQEKHTLVARPAELLFEI